MLRILFIVLLSINLYSHETSVINFNKPAYTTDNLFYKSNKNLAGQCTWFVYGIVKERFDINLKFAEPFGRHANQWPRLLDMELHQTPRANSIAIWKGNRYGHVVFVENYKRGRIWFREANGPHGIKHKVDNHDGLLKSLNIRSFNRRTGKLLGYIYIGNL